MIKIILTFIGYLPCENQKHCSCLFTSIILFNIHFIDKGSKSQYVKLVTQDNTGYMLVMHAYNPSYLRG
jgi:hypothetical protein